MKKIILAPDSFKGTMDATTICNIMEAVAHRQFPTCEVLKIPVADGGEGTVSCFLTAMPGSLVQVKVKGPYFEQVDAFYGLLHNGKTAIIEMAAAASLALAKERRDPSLTTTFGVGELILHAIKCGATELLIGLGGSCTNDGGCGALAAIGVQFYDAQENAFIPTGATLSAIHRIDVAETKLLLDGIKVTILTDVENPLFGESGAAQVFAPQKGADPAMVEALDAGLRHFSTMIQHTCNLDFSNRPGAGAAGGMGAGLCAFLGAKIKSGIDTLLEVTEFEQKLVGCDMVFTGEGRIDAQSVQGKVVSGIAKKAAAQGVPVCVVVGGIGEDIAPLYDLGVSSIFSINQNPLPFDVAKLQSEANLEKTFENILRLISAVSK
ncbi:MAG: glycerate kinase [Clostridia bacterium]